MVTARRIIIASGGTGGHFYPGFALAQELRARGWQPLFIVKKDDIARPALEEADLPYAELDMSALPRSLNPFSHAAFLLKLAGALRAAGRIVADFRPDALFGTGSYVAFPAALAARLAGTPVYIHESNAKFGLGNRLAGLFCRTAALGLPVKDNPLAAKSLMAGTPLRGSFSSLARPADARMALGLQPDRFTVLVFGGSQGSRALNSAFISAFRVLKGDLQAVHVTGRGNFEQVRAAYAEAGLEDNPGLRLFDYYEDIPSLFAAADLAVTRSGAGTVAELAQLRVPAILVPLPTSAGGHQKENAMVLARAGAAICLEEGPDFAPGLEAAIRNFIGDPELAKRMTQAYAGAGVPPGLGAAAALADMIEKDTVRRL